MPFFHFGRKIELSKEYSLADIPVFSSLTPFEQKAIEKKARLVELKRGDIVYEEDTPPDAFYVVISGRFRLFLKGKPGRPEKTLIFFHRGDHFSEVSLMTGKMHSASVEAKRDGVLLKLEKDDFIKLVNEFPSISLFLNRSLGYRLTKVEAAHKHQQEIKISALYARESSAAALQCWLDLAGTLSQETKRKVIFMDFVSPVSPFLKDMAQFNALVSFNVAAMDPSRESDLKACIAHLPQNGADYLHVSTGEEKTKDERKFSTLITFLTYRYDYVLIRLPEDLDNASFKLLKLSDGVYVYSEVSGIEDMSDAIKEFQQGIGFSKSEIRVILPDQDGPSTLSLKSEEEILGTQVFAFLPARAAQPDRYGQVMKYIAKEFAGTLLGLALGSGAAYGLAHIGVLKVLIKNGIRPDVIAGSSIGALVGGLYAAGYDIDELENIAKSIDLKTGFFKLLGFQDMSAAHRGFFKGNQVARWLESHIGDKTFRDLRLPLKIVAANLFTSEEVIIDSGRVVDAIRASISIPGIFRPVLHQGTYLIDGGVVDPLPVRILASHGVKKIIAVNVLPGPKDRIERNRMKEEEARLKEEAIARKHVWSRLFSRGKDKVYNRYAVNIFNVIMSTIQFLEYVIAESMGTQADVVIHPIVRDAHWAEFYSAEKFIKLGAEKTELQMEEIKRLMAE
jgi:NTE family protein